MFSTWPRLRMPPLEASPADNSTSIYEFRNSQVNLLRNWLEGFERGERYLLPVRGRISPFESPKVHGSGAENAGRHKGLTPLAPMPARYAGRDGGHVRHPPRGPRGPPGRRLRPRRGGVHSPHARPDGPPGPRRGEPGRDAGETAQGLACQAGGRVRL